MISCTGSLSALAALLLLAAAPAAAQQNVCVYPRDSVEAAYRSAYAEMKAMLEGGAEPSFKRAVFLTENAWFANRVSYFDFDSQVKALAHMCRKIAKSGVELPSERHKSIALNYAIFKFMTDTTRMLEPGRGTSVFTPFRYDFEDAAGAADWRNTFVMKLLVEKRGNCRALPYLYKMLADELGAEANLSLAPNHVYIKHRGAPDRSGQRRMHNVELTSASFPKDSWVMASGYITLPGIQNALYMDTLSREESIALCLTDLAQGYLRRLGGGPLADSCAALALRHHPENANALLLQAERLLAKWQAAPTGANFAAMEAAYNHLVELGHRQMPEQMYLDWLVSARADGESYYKTDTAAPRFDPRENAPDPDMPYQTLTNGYYDECPLCDSLITIGEVRLNTNTGKITGFVQRDTLRSEATLEPTVVSRWLSVDPVVHPYESPYVAFANNPVWFVDPDGRKIKLAGRQDKYGDTRQATLKHLQSLTDDQLAMNNETGEIYFTSQVVDADETAHSSGTMLVRKLVGHERTVTVDANNSLGFFKGDYANNNNTLHFWDKNSDDPEKSEEMAQNASIDGTGTNAIINFLPNKISDHDVIDPNNPGYMLTEEQKAPQHISLGHELIHAEHIMDGTVINANKKATHQFKYKVGSKTVERTTEPQPIEELRTIGIEPHAKPGETTENGLRKEHNIPERAKY